MQRDFADLDLKSWFRQPPKIELGCAEDHFIHKALGASAKRNTTTVEELCPVCGKGQQQTGYLIPFNSVSTDTGVKLNKYILLHQATIRNELVPQSSGDLFGIIVCNDCKSVIDIY